MPAVAGKNFRMRKVPRESGHKFDTQQCPLSACRFEPEIVAEVMKHVLTDLNRTPLPLPPQLVGIDKRVKDELEYLQSDAAGHSVQVRKKLFQRHFLKHIKISSGCHRLYCDVMIAASFPSVC